MSDEDITEETDVNAIIAQALFEQSKKGSKMSTRERLIATLMTIMLSTGAGGGVAMGGLQWLRAPSPEVIQRLDSIEAQVSELSGIVSDLYMVIDDIHPEGCRRGSQGCEK